MPMPQAKADGSGAGERRLVAEGAQRRAPCEFECRDVRGWLLTPAPGPSRVQHRARREITLHRCRSAAQTQHSQNALEGLRRPSEHILVPKCDQLAWVTLSELES